MLTLIAIAAAAPDPEAVRAARELVANEVSWRLDSRLPERREAVWDAVLAHPERVGAPVDAVMLVFDDPGPVGWGFPPSRPEGVQLDLSRESHRLVALYLCHARGDDSCDLRGLLTAEEALARGGGVRALGERPWIDSHLRWRDLASRCFEVDHLPLTCAGCTRMSELTVDARTGRCVGWLGNAVWPKDARGRKLYE